MDPFGLLGKSWLRSLTMIGLAIFVGGSAGFEVLCAGDSPLLSAETCASGKAVVQYVGGALAAIGIRRAVTA